MNALQQFGRRLALLRRRAQLSQEALAERAGLSRNYIGLLEGSQRWPSLDTVMRIQKALAVDVMDLISNEKPSFVLLEEASGYQARSPSKERDRLMKRLKECTPEELNTVSRVVSEILKLRRKKRSKKR